MKTPRANFSETGAGINAKRREGNSRPLQSAKNRKMREAKPLSQKSSPAES